MFVEKVSWKIHKLFENQYKQLEEVSMKLQNASTNLEEKTIGTRFTLGLPTLRNPQTNTHLKEMLTSY
jgi:hypothetical protein